MWYHRIAKISFVFITVTTYCNDIEAFSLQISLIVIIQIVTGQFLCVSCI